MYSICLSPKTSVRGSFLVPIRALEGVSDYRYVKAYKHILYRYMEP